MSYITLDKKREYQKEWCRKRRASWVKLLGGKCVDCGNKSSLEFDHIKREDKSYAIGSMLSWAESRVMKELNKCVLRCHSCHIKKSLLVGDLPQRAQHGDYSYYKHHKCRCDKCRKANALFMAGYRMRLGIKY